MQQPDPNQVNNPTSVGAMSTAWQQEDRRRNRVLDQSLGQALGQSAVGAMSRAGISNAAQGSNNVWQQKVGMSGAMNQARAVQAGEMGQKMGLVGQHNQTLMQRPLQREQLVNQGYADEQQRALAQMQHEEEIRARQQGLKQRGIGTALNVVSGVVGAAVGPKGAPKK